MSNKFHVLASMEDVDGLEVRSDVAYEEKDGDVATSKLDGEISKTKKGRSYRRNTPSNDRLTRSVAKKGTSTIN